jgi:hypothetical protein
MLKSFLAKCDECHTQVKPATDMQFLLQQTAIFVAGAYRRETAYLQQSQYMRDI